MTAAQQVATPANPLQRLAERVPGDVAFGIAVVAKLVGVALALWYAYDQDTLFPGEHFPRTWTIVGLTSAIALISCVPARVPGSAFIAALGAGMLIFGGANLAHRAAGVGVVLAGTFAGVAVAAWNHQRGEKVATTLLGLLAAGVLTGLAIAVVVAMVDE